MPVIVRFTAPHSLCGVEPHMRRSFLHVMDESGHCRSVPGNARGTSSNPGMNAWRPVSERAMLHGASSHTISPGHRSFHGSLMRCHTVALDSVDIQASGLKSLVT